MKQQALTALQNSARITNQLLHTRACVCRVLSRYSPRYTPTSATTPKENKQQRKTGTPTPPHAVQKSDTSRTASAPNLTSANPSHVSPSDVRLPLYPTLPHAHEKKPKNRNMQDCRAADQHSTGSEQAETGRERTYNFVGRVKRAQKIDQVSTLRRIHVE